VKIAHWPFLVYGIVFLLGAPLNYAVRRQNARSVLSSPQWIRRIIGDSEVELIKSATVSAFILALLGLALIVNAFV
jgi:hypothetical protein